MKNFMERVFVYCGLYLVTFFAFYMVSVIMETVFNPDITTIISAAVIVVYGIIDIVYNVTRKAYKQDFDE